MRPFHTCLQGNPKRSITHSRPHQEKSSEWREPRGWRSPYQTAQWTPVGGYQCWSSQSTGTVETKRPIIYTNTSGVKQLFLFKYLKSHQTTDIQGSCVQYLLNQSFFFSLLTALLKYWFGCLETLSYAVHCETPNSKILKYEGQLLVTQSLLPVRGLPEIGHHVWPHLKKDK